MEKENNLKKHLKQTWLYKYCRGFFYVAERFAELVFGKKKVFLDDISKELDGRSM